MRLVPILFFPRAVAQKRLAQATLPETLNHHARRTSAQFAQMRRMLDEEPSARLRHFGF